MKLIMLIATLILSQATFASNCQGIQDSIGLNGEVSILSKNVLVLSYSTEVMVERKCVLVLDENFKSNAKKNRYFPNKQASSSCNVKQVTASKTLTATGKGFIDVESFCAGGGGCAHGEPGPIDSFKCQ